MKYPKTKAFLLFAVEQRLKSSWNFEGELWTDGKNFIVDNKTIWAPTNFDKFDQTKNDLMIYCGLDPMKELVCCIGDEMALRLNLAKWGKCVVCKFDNLVVMGEMLDICPGCISRSSKENNI